MRVSREIKQLIPYKPGKPIAETQREYGLSKVIKLASNENPLGPSPKAIEAVRRHLADLHRYPDPAGYNLLERISALWSVPRGFLALGNGSNEIIDLLIRIFCEPGEKILTTEKAFLAYPICAQAARVETVVAPLKADFTMDMEALAEKALNDPKIRLVFLPNPNNPTGTYVGRAAIEDFLKKVGHRPDLLIVFDEAYNEFVRAEDYASGQEWLAEYPSVVVLRLGVMLAHPEVVDLYHRVRNPFNTNELAQVAALAALDDVEYLKASQKVVWEGLDQIYAGLKSMNLPFFASQANFVLFDTRRNAQQVYELLLRQGLILRPVGNYGLPHHLRWTVGLAEENDAVLTALKDVLGKVLPSV
jgi:histidinol-phosphate aminotransferase